MHSIGLHYRNAKHFILIQYFTTNSWKIWDFLMNQNHMYCGELKMNISSALEQAWKASCRNEGNKTALYTGTISHWRLIAETCVHQAAV